MRESARFNNVIVAIKVAIVLIFVVVGVFYFDTKNWVTAANPEGLFIPPNEGPGEFGWSGVLRAAAVVFFAYIGFDAVSTAAQEARNPRRDMPIGILGSLAICTVLYVLVSVVITGIVPYDKLNVPAPIAVGIDATGLTWLKPLISLAAVLGLTSAILVLLLGQSRILFSMSRDGLLPPWGAKIDQRFHTPYVSTILVGAVATVLAGLLPIGLVAELVSIGHPNGLRPRLHWRAGAAPRPAACRTPVQGAGDLCRGATRRHLGLWFKLGLPETTWTRLFDWMAIGLAIYFLYSIRHSRVRLART